MLTSKLVARCSYLHSALPLAIVVANKRAPQAVLRLDCITKHRALVSALNMCAKVRAYAYTLKNFGRRPARALKRHVRAVLGAIGSRLDEILGRKDPRARTRGFFRIFPGSSHLVVQRAEGRGRGNQSDAPRNPSARIRESGMDEIKIGDNRMRIIIMQHCTPIALHCERFYCYRLATASK